MTATQTFFDQLSDRASSIGSLLCVGLDPEPEALGSGNCNKTGLIEFCKRLIDPTSHLTLVYKPNSAFFERFGSEGFEALKDVIEYIHSKPGRPLVLLDAKRGDIDKTANAYAFSSFETLGADCVTVNAYMGLDTLQPFLAHKDKGVFALCKTSNPGSNDLQTLKLEGGDMIYERVARMVVGDSFERQNQVGLVIGATDVEAMRRIRAKFPNVWILSPGVGAQGGDLEGALRLGVSPQTRQGLVIAVSRQISKAKDPGAEAEKLVAAMRTTLASI
jgi:orotidine 5'-phosphate decarboxylase subfamily 2